MKSREQLSTVGHYFMVFICTIKGFNMDKRTMELKKHEIGTSNSSCTFWGVKETLYMDFC